MKSKAPSYLIGRRDLNPGWIGLYGVTWALQWFSWPFRYFGALAVLWLVNAVLGWHLPIDSLALVIGFGPLAISLLTLLYPTGGWWFELQQGGRRPSEREQAVFGEAFAALRAFDPELRPPRRWFVLDDPEANACAYADTLMVTRGMLDSPSFPAVLAHELGHLNTSDARVSAALYRITTPPRQPVGFPLRLVAFLISGRVGMSIVKTPWALYWRHREALADAYAAKLGQARALADYLDEHALEGDLPTPFKAFGETTHPWTEHRIEGLEASAVDE